MLTHCFPEKFQRRLLITRLRDVAFQYFAFVIHRPPQIVPFAVDLHEHLVQLPAPSAEFHSAHTTLFDLGSKHRTKTDATNIAQLHD